MRLDPGATFGRYTIVSLLGEGGMGSVYRATDTKLERPVALKLLRPDRVKDDERAKGADRLLREARAAATIAHANAVAIYDVGEVDGTPYIAMELVVGKPLRACIGDKSVGIEQRVRWLVDTARALGAAHARGLVHRDVKPENVMLAEDGTIKVLDFGIASSYGRAEPTTTDTNWAPSDYEEWFASFTCDGVLVGTPRYMSPEQLNGAALDGRADQFSWGVMAYELLAGTPPWLGDTVSYTTLLDLLHNEPKPLDEAAPELPAPIVRVVHKALSKSADERFSSMDELVAALAEPKKSAPRSNGKQWLAMLGVAAVSGLGALWIGSSLARSAPSAPASAAPSIAQVIPTQVTAPTVVASSASPVVSAAPPPPRVDATVQRTKVERAPVAESVDAGTKAVAASTTSGAAPARFRDPGF